MTSPLPPRRRDTRNLADLIRHDKQNLKQLGVGFAGGRAPQARPLGTPVLDTDEDDFDPELVEFLNTDTATCATAGSTVAIRLSHEPIEGSEQVFWDGDALRRGEWTRTESVLTVPGQPYFHAGDVFWVDYAFFDNDDQPTGLFDERMADAPVAYYRLGESSGVDMMDASGNARHGYSDYVAGVTLGATSLDDSSTDTAATFNGSTSDIEVTYQTWMDVTTISVVALAKPNAVNGRTIAARDNNGTSGPWRLEYDSTGHPRFLIWIGGVVKIATASSAVATGARHDIAGTFDGTTVRVYVDGVQAGATSATGSLDLNLSQTLSIGRHNEVGSVFDGTIDEFAVYDHALPADRLLAHAHAAGVA